MAGRVKFLDKKRNRLVVFLEKIWSKLRSLAARASGKPQPRPRPQPRLRFLVRVSSGLKKAGLIMVGAGKRVCPACKEDLGRDALAKCTRDPDHVVHKRCVELVRGKCPKCGYPLQCG